MPTYVFRNKKGEEIERFFHYGDAPKTIGEYERIITGLVDVRFKGPGFTKPGIGLGYARKNKVTWGEVETIMANADREAKINEKAKFKKVKENILKHL